MEGGGYQYREKYRGYSRRIQDESQAEQSELVVDNSGKHFKESEDLFIQDFVPDGRRISKTLFLMEEELDIHFSNLIPCMKRETPRRKN